MFYRTSNDLNRLNKIVKKRRYSFLPYVKGSREKDILAFFFIIYRKKSAFYCILDNFNKLKKAIERKIRA